MNYLGLTVDSSADSVDMIVDYEIGKDREYESDVLSKNCVEAITGTDLNMSPVRSPKNDTHDLLSLKFSLDKSQLSDSNIWNATTDKIELCQIVRMIFPAVDSYPKMVITEDTQNLDIKI